ncbi:CaiB/BaiF CoA-transferase family protein [Tamlana sp. 2201CG12-4]|uniref:CaiB/BaiF CoA transferase family protein n=1 Tax=Tamlana sp. 2201CG12-4 TaxID=3112582 RepID=UPI002DBCE8F6|nr:CaiB/BaiF CoA-transferase family protein [Tamlana sp. 2201CG12-4]MEC3907855.1 CaiB/BaiF CoA-transferase family protein [Tamlana sp. 2201CG12-4]
MKPLEGILVLEFCQYLAGPSAGLRLADLGARVIKIERPVTGEGCRQIAIKNLFIDKDSLVFHTINRNKESYTANLKDADDMERIKDLLAIADVMTHNFRPGVMEKIGLDYDTVSTINPKIVYGVVTGYGNQGPWVKKPGQDLLIQSLSGLTYLSGNNNDGPVPMGLAATDILTGTHLAQGILAVLVRKNKMQKGGLVEVSLLESTLDFQFEVLTTHFNDGRKAPERAEKGAAHAYLSAPYGVYKTKDHYISIAMVPLLKLTGLLGIELPEKYRSEENGFKKRNDIMAILQEKFETKTTQEWLLLLEAEDIWCANVFSYKDILEHEGYKTLKMDQDVYTRDGEKICTTRCPIRIDEERYYSKKAAPKVGEDTERIIREFNL